MGSRRRAPTAPVAAAVFSLPITEPRKVPGRQSLASLTSGTTPARRLDAVPGEACRALTAPLPPPPFDPLEVRRIWVTGLGSSTAQARLLAHCLCEYAELDARFLPSGALHAGPPDQASRDALLVFSQGLSPNARFALQSPARWRALGLATEAEAALLELLPQEERREPARQDLLVLILEPLKGVYEDTGRDEEAAKLGARVARIRQELRIR